MANLYTPLDPSKKEIRLIRMKLSSDWFQPICCTISKHFLDSAPPYWALSYAWGDPHNAEPITVGSHVVATTRNLVAFLRELRHQSYEELRIKHSTGTCHGITRALWVDAICINQSNVAERNEQVLLMEQIYSQAEVTVAWLGEPSDNSSLAMNAFQDLAKLLTEMPAGSRTPVQWRDLPERFLLKDMRHEPFNTIWLSVKQLLQRDYWSRAWTFQEMVIPTCIRLMCGSATCDLSHMVFAGCWLWNNLTGECPAAIDPIVWRHMTQVRLYMQELYGLGRAHFHFHGRPGNHRDHICTSWPHPDYDWDVLLTTRGKEATVAHDAVYAFLAVSGLPIRPDYEQPLHQLYLSVARLGVQCKRLEVLLCCAAKIEGHHPESVLTPSWVPEWLPRKQGCEGAFLERFRNIYKANARAPASECASVDENGHLVLTGKICGFVHHIGPVSIPLGISDQVLDILDHYKTSERYVTGIPPLQAVLRTILCDHDGRGLRLLSAAWQNHDAFMNVILLALAGDLQPTSNDSEGPENESTSLLGMPIGEDFVQSYSKAVLDEDSHEGIGNTFKEVVTPFLKTLVERNGEEDEVGQHLSALTYKTRLFMTEQGYLGTAPSSIGIGDCVVVSPYSRLPLVVRKHGSAYQNIGPCFVLGMMDGEVLSDERECETIVIE